MAELDVRLSKLLQKHGVGPKVVQYVRDKNILTVGQFAGLAGSKVDSVEGICVPAGLDGKDRPLCQPVKTAMPQRQHCTCISQRESQKSGEVGGRTGGKREAREGREEAW